MSIPGSIVFYVVFALAILAGYFAVPALLFWVGLSYAGVDDENDE